MAVLAMVAVLAGAGNAAAAGKGYTVDLAPTTMAPGVAVDMTATITNLSGQQQLGSANLAPPPGYTLLSVDPLTAPATASIVDGVLALRELSLQAGASLAVSFSVSTPCESGTVARSWTVVAKQANEFSGSPGNNLRLDTANSDLTTTTVGTCVPCPEDESCSGSLGGQAGSSLNVVSPGNAAAPDAGQLNIFFPNALDCADFDEGQTDTFRFDVPPNRSKVGTLRFRDRERALEVCFASPAQFAPKARTELTTVPVDGQVFYVGLLPNCVGMPVPPCVTSRDVRGREISYAMASGDPMSR